MARFFRRRDRTRFARTGVRSRKPPGNWVPVVAVNEVLSLTGTAVDAFVLLEDEQVDAQSSTLLNRQLTASRVIVQARVRLIPDTASGVPAMSPFVFWYALAVIDNDEQSGLWNTAARGSLLQANRVLHTGIKSGMWARTGTASWGSLTLIPDVDINIDWKGGVTITPEQYLAFAIHTGGNISTAYSGAALNMTARTRLMRMR